MSQASKPPDFNVLFLSDRSPEDLKVGTDNILDLVEKRANGKIMPQSLDDLCGKGNTSEEHEDFAIKARDALRKANGVIIDYSFLLKCQGELKNPAPCRYLAVAFGYGVAQARSNVPVLIVSDEPALSSKLRPEFIYWLYDKTLREYDGFPITEPKVLMLCLKEMKDFALSLASAEASRLAESRLNLRR